MKQNQKPSVLNLFSEFQFRTEMQTLFPLCISGEEATHSLSRKAIASCFESQKAVNSNIIIIKMCQKCFVQTKNFLLWKIILLFSAHISYGKGKYLNQTVFLQNFPSTNFIFNFKGVIHRIQLT